MRVCERPVRFDFVSRVVPNTLPEFVMLTLLRNASIYAPERMGEADVLIADGRIAAIGQNLPSLPTDLPHESYDLRGHLLIPGLIDAHVHLTGGGGEAGPSTRVPPMSLSPLLKAGITSCVGVLGTDGTTRTIRDLVACTLGLRELGMSAWCYTGSYRIPVPTLTGSVRDDVVFVDPILGVGELALSDHRSSQPTLDELLRVASDVYVAGMLSGKAGVLHCHMGSGERGFQLLEQALDTAEIPARVYHPTHINRERWLFDAAKQLVKRGVTVDLTAFPEDGETLMAADAIAEWRAQGHPMDQLTCSSDGAGCLPTFDSEGRLVEMDIGDPITLLQTIQRLLELSEPLETFLPVFTSNVARVLTLPQKGRVAVGADADLAVLTPQGALRHVWAGGQLMVQDGAVCAPGPFESPS
jgi:beta-aspartyl-dipeptidase (metallo-type)